jgi:hypothetical protein
MHFTVDVAPPVITTTELPGAVIDAPYFRTLTATGMQPITWSVSAGELPPGLSLSGDGVISGTLAPTSAESFMFEVKAENGVSPDAYAMFTIGIPISRVLGVSVLPGELNLKSGQAYQLKFAADVSVEGMASNDVIWSTSNSSVTLDQNGNLYIPVDQATTYNTIYVTATSAADHTKFYVAEVRFPLWTPEPEVLA